MSTLKATTIEPATGTNVTLGTTGDTVALPGNTIVLDTWKDSGGNTLFTSNGSGVVSSVNSGLAGAGPVLISTTTASDSATLNITSGIDGTYDKYMIVFINVGGATNNTHFQFNGSTDGGSNYNVTKTTTFFEATHDESGGSAEVAYAPAWDLAQGTGYQPLGVGLGNDADENINGCLYLFSPSSTTYVKQFYCTSSGNWHINGEKNSFIAGYMNTTSAVNAVSFNFASGNIAAGTFKLYGVK